MDFINNIIKGTWNLDIIPIHSAVNEFVYIISAFLNKFLNTSLQKMSVLHWIGLSFFLWVIVHAIFYKINKPILRSIGIKRERDNTNVLISIWTISYCTVSTFLMFISVDDLFNKPLVELMLNKYGQCFGRTNKNYNQQHSYAIFVLCTSFLIHSICWSYKLKGYKNFEFLKKELCVTILVVSFSLRCNQFGMLVLLISNIFTIQEECMKLLFIFNNVTVKSNKVSVFLKLVFAVVSILWSIMHFVVLPRLLYMIINKKVSSSMVLAEFVFLLVLVVGLCVYYVACVIDSPTGRMLVKTVKNQVNGYSLEYFLFGSVSDIMRSSHRLANHSVIRSNSTSSEEYFARKRQNVATVYQTVRCYMTLKRKLKRIREKKMADVANESVETRLLE